MAWCIYRHKDKLNGKCYIGQTKNRPEERWENGRGYAPSGDTPPTKFYARIQEIGWDNFEHEIIEKDIPTLELANEREKYWISFYNSFEDGYNSTIGGAGIVKPGRTILLIKVSGGWRNSATVLKKFYSKKQVQDEMQVPRHRVDEMLDTVCPLLL